LGSASLARAGTLFLGGKKGGKGGGGERKRVHPLTDY